MCLHCCELHRSSDLFFKCGMWFALLCGFHWLVFSCSNLWREIQPFGKYVTIRLFFVDQVWRDRNKSWSVSVCLLFKMSWVLRLIKTPFYFNAETASGCWIVCRVDFPDAAIWRSYGCLRLECWYSSVACWDMPSHFSALSLALPFLAPKKQRMVIF